MRQVHFDASNAFPQRNALADLPMSQGYQLDMSYPPYEPTGGYGAPGYTPNALADFTDRDLLAAVIYSEAGNEPHNGQVAVGNVLMNRVNSGAYPNSIRGVALQPGQFSALNAVTGYAGGEGANDLWMRPDARSYAVADAILAGAADVTGGATHYFQPDYADPAWRNDTFRALPGSSHLFGTAS